MRICYVSTGKTWGGGERLLAWLIAGITATGHEVGLVARQGSPLAAWGRDHSNMPLLQLPGRARSPRSLWRLRKWVVDNRFDAAVFNDPHAITCGGIATLGLDVARLGIRHTVFPVRSAWKHRRLLDHVICVSEAARQECIKSGIDVEQLTVIHGGVSASKLHAKHADQVREMLLRADPAGDDRHLLAIGSLLPVKGFDTLIRAVARGRNFGHKWRLWIAGEGGERAGLKSLAGELGVSDYVHLLGFRDDTAELLAAADAFVSASHSEGLSLVLVEAMLASCPIAATAVGGSREVLDVDDQGHSPFAATFAPGDTAGLAAAVEKSLAETVARQQRLVRAKQWAHEQFSLEQMIQRHLDLYGNLPTVGGRPGDKATRSAA